MCDRTCGRRFYIRLVRRANRAVSRFGPLSKGCCGPLQQQERVSGNKAPLPWLKTLVSFPRKQQSRIPPLPWPSRGRSADRTSGVRGAPLYVIPTKVGIQLFFLDSCLPRHDTSVPAPGPAFGIASRQGAGLTAVLPLSPELAVRKSQKFTWSNFRLLADEAAKLLRAQARHWPNRSDPKAPRPRRR